MDSRSIVVPAEESRVAPRLVKVLAVVLFALLTALGARAAVPLPGTAVPVTLQTLFVLLAGALLGPRLGAASQVVYLAAGVAGLPAFVAGGGPAYLFGPTGGYLLAFPAVAAAAGWVARTAPARGAPALAWLFAGLFLASLIVFVGGAAQLAVLTGDPARAIQVGVLPFLVGDVVKVLVAGSVAYRLRERVASALG
ncbi:MAG TPA: biotin transporter BioY [Longimicrobiales bacterium]|nr:biotin transporter BioY [Longimicrobiales bacterium]